jgi:hypothetical protein
MSLYPFISALPNRRVPGVGLCRLQDVKFWVYGDGLTDPWPTAGDGWINAMIDAASRHILAYCQLDSIAPRIVVQRVNGLGRTTLVLRESPVLEVYQLSVGTQIIPPRPDLIASNQPVVTSGVGVFGIRYGYVLEEWDGFPPAQPQSVLLDGGLRFPRQIQNVCCTYIAGYAERDEVAIVPGDGIIVPGQMYGLYSGDCGVTYEDGTPLVAVTGAPSAGQYVAPAKPPATVVGEALYTPSYTFSVTDAGRTVLLSYAYVPSDLAHACVSWVGERLSYRQRIGEKSKALPGGTGTATYEIGEMPAQVKSLLAPYRRFIPAA